MNYTDITIKQYLDFKGIEHKEHSGELITKCVFNECDQDSRGTEAHLYFSIETGQYQCKKCGEEGNLLTLAKFFGDTIKTTVYSKPSPKICRKETKEQITSELVEKCHQALPDRIREYLRSRGITDAIIDHYQLGWGQFYGADWITIPIADQSGKNTMFKLRRDPDTNTNSNKMMVYPKGSKHEIYGWEIVADKPSKLFVCEGEFDRLVLMANGIPSITSTGGCGTFKKDWLKPLASIDSLYICYDNDEEGQKGATKLIGKFLDLEGPLVFNIVLPEMGEKENDVTDFFISHGGNPDNFMALAKQMSIFNSNLRIVKIEEPFKEIKFNEWQDTVNQHFIHCMFPAEVCLSIISQILIHDISNPFALVLIDVPSSGKTITVNFFDDMNKLTYASDKFTPAAFVSNAVNVSREKLSEIDLLPRIRYKSFLVRDLATLFSKRDDDLNECMGILTRVLDGEGFKTDTGIHGQREYTGEYLFMMIAASTPIPTRVWKMMGSLGSRLFFLNMKSPNKSDEELMNQLTTTAFKQKERICRNTTKNLLYTLWSKYPHGIEWNKEEDPEDVLKIIPKCSKLLARLRGVISVWKEKRLDNDEIEFDYTPPIIEKPDRINQLFYNLCRGHALVTGRTQINQEDLKLIVELAIDSAPSTRAMLFRGLLEHNGQMTTSKVQDYLHCTKPPALREMRTLEALGVCEVSENTNGQAGQPELCIKLKEDFLWFLTDECNNIRGIPTENQQCQNG